MEPLAYFAVAAVSAAVVYALVRWSDQRYFKSARQKAEEIVQQTEKDLETRRKVAELELNERALKRTAEIERESTAVQQKLHTRERELDRRESALEQQGDFLKKQEKFVEANQLKLTNKMEEADRRNEELAKRVEEQKNVLQQLSGLTRDEAAKELFSRLEAELAHQAGTQILKHQKKMHEQCEAKSREILVTALQRYAAAHTAETTTSTVDIPSDDMKGRIIGRDGRNIRAFEKATGVDVIIDDTPGVVIVSGFDAVRREVARISLHKLIADGRIHPSRIEEVVAETQAELDKRIVEFGEEAARECDIPGLHEKVIVLLGRLRFRTSYSQNVLRHSIEVAFLAGSMAEELGMDGALARRCGLLHDIGKAADHEMEGGHPKIGADILKRCGEREEVVHAALGHHDDLRPDRPYTVLVAAADACSASRPGARRETLERYTKRLEDLEAVAHAFPGVEQAYAIQAGRELRVIASSKDTTDASAAKMCHDIARRIEETLTYPGEIRVTVLRESVFNEAAK